MMTISYDVLKEQMDTVKGTTFAGLSTLTDVKLKGGKKNPHQGRITKKTIDSNVILFSNTKDSGYVSIIRKRMLSEGKDPDTFEPKARAWGTRIGSSPFIEHNGKYYLECFFISPGRTTYYLDGEEIAKEDIEGLEDKAKTTESDKYIESQGGIENKVVVRTFSLDSIVSIALKGELITNDA